MRPHRILSRLENLKPTVLAAALLAAFLGLCAFGIVSSTAQSAQDDDKDERKFENTIPAHVPLKVKVKNEQSFKKRENKNWARELEVEVKNTGSKPIYFMYMLLVMPDVTVGGYPYAMQVHYGRKELVRLNTPLQADDIPILPGESVTLKISDDQVKGYEGSRNVEKRADPKKVEFDLQLINFGDGTGLRSKQGRPHPDPARKKSSNAPYIKESPKARLPTSRVREVDLSSEVTKQFNWAIPASFLRVKFFPASDAPTSCSTASLPDLCGCQNSFNCFFGTLDFATCPCDNPEAFFAFIPTSCNNSFGACSRTQTVTQSCATQYNGTQYC